MRNNKRGVLLASKRNAYEGVYFRCVAQRGGNWLG